MISMFSPARIISRCRLFAVVLLLFFGHGSDRVAADSPYDAVVRSVFCISGRDSSGNTVAGTGFLVQGRSDEKNSAWLLTTGHTLARISGHLQIGMRRQTRGVYFPFPVTVKIREGSSQLYYLHPEYDLAAIKIALPAEADCCVQARDFVADDARLARSGFGSGVRLLIPGFPYGESCNEAGFPFVRDGVVSSFPVLPTSIQPVFYADFEVFEGYSGAPVIYGEGSGAGFLVGMILEEVFIEELRNRDGRKTTRTRRGLGLAKVLSAPLIRSFVAALP